MVRVLDLRACGQSDVTNAERKGVFGDLRLSRFLQSKEEESQWMVSSFAYLSLSLSVFISVSLRVGFLVCGRRFPSFWSGSAVEKFVFYSVFVFRSDQIGFSLFVCFFLPRKSRIGRKIAFDHFYFLKNSIDISLCADPMRRSLFFHFEESHITDNIRWILSWTLVWIIILCVR